ncbi:hypothetical protein ACWPKS_04345 [Coraliomargarita sp. W4R72]
MKTTPLIIFLICALCFTGEAQQATYNSYLGYAYPSGGQTGTSFEVIVGGRYLSAPKSAVVSGSGVEATIIKHYRMVRRINGTQKIVLKMQLAQREFELSGVPISKWVQGSYDKLTEAEIEKEKVPEHPLFDDIQTKTLIEIKHLNRALEEYNTRQANDQIGEQLKIKITINAAAEPGIRELRVLSRAGLSNPIRFQISQLTEHTEQEPNDARETYSIESPPESLPSVINGQITPGDVDRFRIEARQGQTIKFDLLARRLIPYLADAVPGWFQATLAIYDTEGKRLLYIDDNYGNPDPMAEFTFPSSGSYIIEIRDALYRGCENFVYRLHIDDVSLTAPPIRNPDVDYMTTDLPYTKEQEPNGSLKEAHVITLPKVIAGVIRQREDSDLFQFSGKQGETVIAQIEARCFDSPLDSLLRIVNANGEILAFNDDFMEKRQHLHLGPGLQTHYADSYLNFTLPESGVYTVSVEDVQRNGGDDYKYRLRLSHPIPDFELRLLPSSLNVGASGCVELRLYLKRTDDLTGPVSLRLVNAPAGARLHNAVIPAGQNEGWTTLEWPAGKDDRIEIVQIEAVAQVNGKEIKHPVIAADDSMQAFLWRHLLPAQALNIAPLTNSASFSYSNEVQSTVLSLSANQDVTHVIPLTVAPKQADRFHFRLKEAPAGVTVTHAKIKENTIQIQFHCSEALSSTPSRGNLLVEATRKDTNKKNKKTSTTSLGVLPAIAYEIHTQ